MMYGNWYGQSFGVPTTTMIGLGLFAGLIAIIALVLKGYALWHAAKRDEKVWFIVLLIVNTVGILELIYLVFVVKKWRNLSVMTVDDKNHQA